MFKSKCHLLVFLNCITLLTHKKIVDGSEKCKMGKGNKKCFAFIERYMT